MSDKNKTLNEYFSNQSDKKRLRPESNNEENDVCLNAAAISPEKNEEDVIYFSYFLIKSNGSYLFIFEKFQQYAFSRSNSSLTKKKTIKTPNRKYDTA